MTADDEMEEDKVEQERGENDNNSMNISELNLSRESNEELTTSPAHRTGFPNNSRYSLPDFRPSPPLRLNSSGNCRLVVSVLASWL